MVMAARRWSCGISSVRPIRLLLVVLILLLTSGKALELRTKLGENVESFEDAQRAAKAMNNKQDDGVDAPESAVKNIFEELDKWNQETSSSELLESLETVENAISRLSEHLSGEEKMQFGEIMQVLGQDMANLIPEELQLEDYSIEEALAQFELIRDTLKNMIYLLDNPEAYEAALEKVNKVIETELTPEERDRLEAQFYDAVSQSEEMQKAFTSLQDNPENLQDLDAILQESLQLFANVSESQNFADGFAPKEQEACKSKSHEAEDVHSHQKHPQKNSKWANKV